MTITAGESSSPPLHAEEPLPGPRARDLAVWTYLWSLAFPTPQVKGTSDKALSAASTAAAIAAAMTSGKRFQQDMGIFTKTPADDIMITVAK